MFCRNCGNELHENAYVCVKCGQLVPNYKKPKKEQGIENLTGYFMTTVCGTSLLTFFLLSFAAGCLTLMLAILSVAFGEISTGYYNSWHYFYPLDGCAIFSFIFSLICIGSGITQFILGLKRGGVLKLIVIANFIFSIAMAFLGFGMLASTWR